MMTSRVWSPARKDTRASLTSTWPCFRVVPQGLPSMVQPGILISTKGNNSLKLTTSAHAGPTRLKIIHDKPSRVASLRFAAVAR